MAKIVPVLEDMGKQIDGLELNLTQLSAPRLAQEAAEGADLDSAHAEALHIASRLAKAAAEALFLCRRIENVRNELNASAGRAGKDVIH